MRRIAFVLLLAAACSSTARRLYVPGGADLPREAKVAYRAVQEHLRNGDRAAALAGATDLCERYPLRLGFHLLRLRLARAELGPEGAAAHYDPPPPGVDADRANVLAELAREDPDDASARKAVLEFAAAREPDEAFWRLALAELGLDRHDALVARGERERELGQVQDSAETFVEAGRVLDRVREETEAALALDPQFAEAYVLLGYVRTRQADLAAGPDEADAFREAAGEAYTRALEHDPESVAALVNVAENHLTFDRYFEAQRALRRAAELAPDRAVVWNNLGYSFYALGRLDGAIRCYREVLRLEPANARVRTALSDCLRRTGKPEAAVDELERARADAAEDPGLRSEIAFKLGAIHEHEGRYREAVAAYERHIELGGEESAKARSRIREIYARAFE